MCEVSGMILQLMCEKVLYTSCTLSIVVQAGVDPPRLQMYLKLPGSLGEKPTFSRDVTSIGHWGTSNLEVNVRTIEDWEKVRILVEQAYQES